MLSQLKAKLVAVKAAVRALHRYKCRSFVLVIPIGVLAGCAQPTTLPRGADPANARAPVPPVSYRSATAAYRAMRPSPPASWRQQNDSVAPQTKPDQ